MNMIKKSLLLLLPAALLLAGCGNDEQNVTPTDDNEAITTATLTLTSQTTPVQTVTATVENLNTSADFSKATLLLRPNTTYTGALTLLDKTKTPTLNVSAGILQEANEHLVVYTPAPAALLTVTITDKDTNPAPGPFPLGLATQVRTGAAGSGSLKVVLRHQPDVKNGTATPGTSDLDVTLPVVVQ